jgi:hypothetical protein
LNATGEQGIAPRTAERVTVAFELPTTALTVVAAPPMRVSQRTCEHALGIPKRVFLDSLPAYRASGGEVIAHGKLRLVEPSAYLGWLRIHRGQVREVDEVAAIAAELGLSAAGKRRQPKALLD